jgi:3-ketosteroid 9alpha-monooxygenase subunit A
MATTAEYGLGEYAFPRGWFMIAAADEVGDTPLPLRFFGHDFALYRGESGRVVLLDAYCPHMGTHIAKNTTSYVVIEGQIEGDSIRCPYHAWRFGPDGKCDDIPYHDGPIPEAACIKSWPVVESLGCIFVWHDPEEGEPEYPVPVVEEWNNPAWVHWKIDHLGELESHPQEVIDNIVDVAHLGPIHGSTLQYYENEFRGHLVIQRQGGGHKTLVEGNALLETDTWYTGPGILLSRLTGLYDAVMFIAHTPVEDGSLKAWHGLLVKSDNEVATEADVAMARAYQEAALLAVAQDLEVWSAKRPCTQVLQIRSDGPYGKLRTWYKQFYNPRAEANEWHAKVNGTYTVKWLESAPEAVIAAGKY